MYSYTYICIHVGTEDSHNLSARLQFVEGPNLINEVFFKYLFLGSYASDFQHFHLHKLCFLSFFPF